MNVPKTTEQNLLSDLDVMCGIRSLAQVALLYNFVVDGKDKHNNEGVPLSTQIN
jgi:hypothetical protein